MNWINTACALAVLMGMTACANVSWPMGDMSGRTAVVPLDKLVIKSRFEAGTLTRDNFEQLAAQCLPLVDAGSPQMQEGLANFPGKKDVLWSMNNSGSANTFLVRELKSLCLQTSQAGYPILATEVFDKTINPNGVSREVQDDWYKQIALQLARKGAVKLAFAFTNGNAHVAEFWFDPDRNWTLAYRSSFKKAGAWSQDGLGAVFTDSSMTGVAESKWGDETKKYIF